MDIIFHIETKDEVYKVEQINKCEKSKASEPQKISFGKKTSMQSVLVRTAGFLLARAMPISGVAPFGLSFVALERRFTAEAVVSGAMAAAGCLTLLDKAVAIRYITCIAAYLLFLFVADRESGDIPMPAAAGASVTLIILSGCVQLIWSGVSTGGILRILADAALAAAGILVLERNRGILKGRRSSVFAMNKEEKLCMILTAAIALTGFKNLRAGVWISAVNIIGFWCVAQFAICGGAGCGAVEGLIIGILAGSWDTAAELAAVYALCGAAGGALSRRGKYAAGAAMFITAAAASLFCMDSSGVIGYADIPIGTAAVMLTPDIAARTIGRISGIKRGGNDDIRCRDYIKTRLESAADSFRVLAQTFLDLSDKNREADMEDISLMFDGVAERVCRECSKLSKCWVNSFDHTYKSLFKMLKIMEDKGELNEGEADECFGGSCLRCRRLANEMNRLFEIYKINCVWKSKLCENRELAGQQLASVAQILDGISDELYEERIDSGAEEEIRMRLSAKKIEVTELDVTLGINGRYFAYIGAIADENADAARRAAESALHAVLGAKMAMVGASRRNRGEILMRFAQPEGYMIEAGMAAGGACDVSGDNCVMRYLSDGKYAAALSDGMGTGKRASRDSGATVRVLGDFLEAGFDRTIAVRLVNSIMVMKSANEAFATVDMCVIDLYSGEAEFIKNGAEPSYIKRGSAAETVRAASLPVGVIQDMEIETFAHRLCGGDVIVMLSDGLQMKKGHEDWIKNFVEEADPEMPAQELADRIMDMAKTLCGEDIRDDMTVMVMKLLERSA